MFSVLISGKLTKDPRQGVGRTGQTWCTGSLRIPVQAQHDGEADWVFASVIAFGDEAGKLARLVAGDTISVSGTARLSHWEKDGREMTGLNVSATGILSAYDVDQRSEAMQSSGSGRYVAFDDSACE